MTPSSQRGVALVITLIMLSVITVIAVAFLAVSRRERSAVGQTMNQADAELAADAGRQRGRAQIIAYALLTTNLLGPDFTASANFINRTGFNTAISVFDGNNVNYDYTTSTQALTQPQFQQNVANLYYDPRVPVFVLTNRETPREFRYYLDLNRNGRFDETGLFAELDDAGMPIRTNGVAMTRYFAGDAQWIGILQRPNLPHSATNRFIARYAYVILPVGRLLDLNFIHNDAKRLMDGGGFGFFRNQGFGTWENNLAGFLVDLNTNSWNPLNSPYNFNTNLLVTSSGLAFQDARDLLRYRYNGLLANLDSVNTIFPGNGAFFSADLIDEYGNGPLPVYGQGSRPVSSLPDNDLPALPWPGANSKKQFFSLQDVFDAAKTPGYSNFISRLAQASARTNTYDRYTYYNLISQLGVDSAPEPERADLARLMQKISAQRPEDFPPEPVGRINLNFDNLDQTAASFSNWTAIRFFTNVADVLLRSQFNFGITNIPVAPTNFYSSAVHRLLQVAANIHDSTTDSPFPSVFRPQLTVDGNNVFISGYEEDNRASTVRTWLTNNPYGIPFVVGAKKGLPNFNEFVMQTAVQCARKLELRRTSTNSPPNQTNQMFIIGVSNLFGLEGWNSYTQAFSGELLLEAGLVSTMTLTNSDKLFYMTSGAFGISSNILPNQWTGFKNPQNTASALSFKVPLRTNVVMLTNSVYRSQRQPPSFDPVGVNIFEPSATVGYPVPEWGLSISNRLTYILSSGGRILDFVHLPQLTTYINVTAQLMGIQGDGQEPAAVASTWLTNRINNSTLLNVPTEGIASQIEISLGNRTLSQNEWNDYNNDRRATTGSTKNKAIDGFRAFFKLPLLYFKTNEVENSSLIVQAPFSPTRKFYQTINWQVNDPLVHYMAEDVRDFDQNPTPTFVKPLDPPPASNLGQLNERYKPWGGNPSKDSAGDPNNIYLGVKDPGVFRSDDWDFPTNKLPNVGSLGRIHRGTPWQTIYLKSDVATEDQWRRQSLITFSHPTNDWRLIDMFTVALHPNASRGQLSINQSGLAAWSAVLSGVSVLSNLPPNISSRSQTPGFENRFIEPASTQLKAIVDGINLVRALQPGQTFRRLGELLSVPELTVASPFLTQTSDEDILYGLTDVAYEQIPQQILSLLKVGEGRFVVYAYGQSLKPADRSIITSGPFFNMCTNYQITGEVLTRSVLRLDGTGTNPRLITESFNILPLD